MVSSEIEVLTILLRLKAMGEAWRRGGGDVWRWCGCVEVVWVCGGGVGVWRWWGCVEVVWMCGGGVGVWRWKVGMKVRNEDTTGSTLRKNCGS